MRQVGMLFCRHGVWGSSGHPSRPMPSLPREQVEGICWCPGRQEGGHWHPVYEDGSVGWEEVIEE